MIKCENCNSMALKIRVESGVIHVRCEKCDHLAHYKGDIDEISNFQWDEEVPKIRTKEEQIIYLLKFIDKSIGGEGLKDDYPFDNMFIRKIKEHYPGWSL